MGRIADALKKADAERRHQLRIDAIGGTPLLRPPRIRDADETGSNPKDQEFRAESNGAVADCGIHQSRDKRAPSRSPLLEPTPNWEVDPLVVAACERSSTITEQYRAARTWLLRRNAGPQRSCVALTSSVPREGKSVTTANLAVVMAEVRHLQVLAVDCDFRQGSLARLFKMPNSPGLSDVLAGRARLDEAIARTPLGNLSLLPAGNYQDLKPTELLSSKAAAQVFDEIRERYHFSLVDTPPVQWLSDVGVIGALCTGIVMVVRMNKTASHRVRQSVHWLQANNLDVIGCIAADCTGKGTRYEYQGGNDD